MEIDKGDSTNDSRNANALQPATVYSVLLIVAFGWSILSLGAWLTVKTKPRLAAIWFPMIALTLWRQRTHGRTGDSINRRLYIRLWIGLIILLGLFVALAALSWQSVDDNPVLISAVFNLFVGILFLVADSRDPKG